MPEPTRIQPVVFYDGDRPVDKDLRPRMVAANDRHPSVGIAIVDELGTPATTPGALDSPEVQSELQETLQEAADGPLRDIQVSPDPENPFGASENVHVVTKTVGSPVVSAKS